MTNGNVNQIGASLAGGAIASALLETLLTKNVLNLGEAREVLRTAMNSLVPYMQAPEGYQASQIIAGMLRERFSART